MTSPENTTCMVIAAVIKRQNKFLVCQRPEHKRHGSLWEFPGGKLEPGESMLDAAQRELREELGVVVTAAGEIELAVGDPGSPFLINFVAVEVEGEPQALEHVAIAWIPKEKLLDLALAPSDRSFALHLNGLTGES